MKHMTFWLSAGLGFAAGAVASTAMMNMADSTAGKRIKRSAHKAAQSMGELAEDLTDWMQG
jgi:hypothetical protein